MFQKDILKGKRILVTGGGTGLGKEMAAEYASLGASVYICGRRQSVLDETVNEITETGGDIKGYACDIRVSDAVNDMIDTIWKDGGALTGLVNNAAGNFISPTKDLSPRGFEAISNIVFRGSFYVTHSCGTKWIDGPLTRAVKSGGICYLDEVVEARKDTTVIIHPLTDHRRTLSIDKLGQVIQADDGFLLVVSYNPGYQNAVKDLKHSTRQRFVAIEFDFPDVDRETKIIAHESGLEEGMSNQLAVLGQKIRNLREHGLEEGASTRLLIYAARLIKQGISPKRACQVALTWGITDEVQIQETVDQIVSSIFE